MCGIVGLVAHGPVNQALFDALTVLQHRGQDAAGMVTCQGGRFFLRKDSGLVRDVIRTRHMIQLAGHGGIGHLRYPTAGSDSTTEAQPFYVNSPFGIAMAHNGNLTNAIALKDELFKSDRRHLNTDSDSEVLLNVFAHELHSHSGLLIRVSDVFAAVAAVHRRVRGAYSVVALINGFGLVAFRDPHGIRPLCYGHREGGGGTEVLVASESVALDALGFEFTADLAPGEALCVTFDGTVHRQSCAQETSLSPCLFEYVYFARPDSVIDGVSVHRARLRMGEVLANKIRRTWSDHDIDVVIPVPESSRSSALELALTLGVPYREGLIKNRYIARTFIMPGQRQRKRSVRQKLNPIPLEFQGKNVLLVDDSIVRGTTSREIVQMAREAGARRVYFASAAPPVRFPNVYGIDLATASELIASGRTEEEVAVAIGVDRLIYQDLADLTAAVRRDNPGIYRFEDACFSGCYLTGDVDPGYLQGLAARRSSAPEASGAFVSVDGDEGEGKAVAGADSIDLHNPA
ncbi:MAG: amidophosphoribosyltransferase [Candidatus Competibacterales bacterium]